MYVYLHICMCGDTFVIFNQCSSFQLGDGSTDIHFSTSSSEMDMHGTRIVVS